jgi:hypothetical protein
MKPGAGAPSSSSSAASAGRSAAAPPAPTSPFLPVPHYPKVTIHDDSELWQFVREGFEQRLPLRQLTVRNRTGTTQQIDPLPLQLQLRSSKSQSRVVAALRSPGAATASAVSSATERLAAQVQWYKQSYVTIVLLKAENFELYRNSQRAALQELLDTIRSGGGYNAPSAASAPSSAASTSTIASTSSPLSPNGPRDSGNGASLLSGALPPSKSGEAKGTDTKPNSNSSGGSGRAPQEVMVLFVPTVLNKLAKTTKKIWERLKDDFPKETICRLDLFDADSTLPPATPSLTPTGAQPQAGAGAGAASRTGAGMGAGGGGVGPARRGGPAIPPPVAAPSPSQLQLQWEELMRSVAKLLVKSFEARYALRCAEQASSAPSSALATHSLSALSICVCCFVVCVSVLSRMSTRFVACK